jgi:hypothetical protein
MAMAATYRFIPKQTALLLYGMRILIARVFAGKGEIFLLFMGPKRRGIPDIGFDYEHVSVCVYAWELFFMLFALRGHAFGPPLPR